MQVKVWTSFEMGYAFAEIYRRTTYYAVNIVTFI